MSRDANLDGLDDCNRGIQVAPTRHLELHACALHLIVEIGLQAAPDHEACGRVAAIEKMGQGAPVVE
jgi:hypothetical protein